MSDIDPTELERVIRKIKHCLALSASSNEHEAAAAMRQAQKLMAKYRLTETQVNLSDVGMAHGADAKAKREQWEIALSSVVGEVFDCNALTLKEWCDKTLRRVQRSVFVGVSPAPEIAKYAYDTLHRQCMTARREYLGKIKRGELPRSSTSANTRGGHFALYWVDQVEGKIRALVPTGDDTPDHSESDSRALVAIKSKSQDLIDAYLKDLTGGEGVTEARRRRKMDIDPVDAISGMRAGQRAQVSHGVGTMGDPLTAIGQAPAGTQGSFL